MCAEIGKECILKQRKREREKERERERERGSVCSDRERVCGEIERGSVRGERKRGRESVCAE